MKHTLRARRAPVILTAVATAAAVTTVAPSAMANPGNASAANAAAKSTLVYSHLALPNGNWAEVWSDGLAEVHQGANPAKAAVEQLPTPNGDAAGAVAQQLPAKGQLVTDLIKGAAQQYRADQVVVIYRQGASAAQVNNAQSGLGVDRSRRVYTGASKQRMTNLRTKAQNKTGRALLDFPDARVLHLTKASVPDAVAKLRANPNVAFAEPNWKVAPTDQTPVPIPAAALRQARAETVSDAKAGNDAGSSAPAQDAPALPDNFALTSSAQSMLNRPADDVIPAYSDIAEKFGQLPGQGEIITNVSLGTLDDASALGNPSDPCNAFVSAFGPTTEVIDGQRYINWPSMPLIPTYTASSAGVLDPTGETCGNDDPQLVEVGLDFSMMAPLPHDQQRPGEVGSGLTDLLGIAPGASYRLVLPQNQGGVVTDVDAALSAAANQSPRPDVITVSLGFGLDALGYPSRYLEDDPMTEATIAAITASGIVVSVSAGDGLRTTTNAAVSPTGGSVPTNVTNDPNKVSDLNDVAESDAPSVDLDSGAMDVGGSTLNDIFANPPDNPANKATSNVQAYPAVRFDGGRLYSSGFGSRVNISAPGDNVISFEHTFGGGDDAVTPIREGGTSASAPEAAAAAAVVLQVARLTHNNSLINNPRAVRAFLESTGTPLPAVKEADVPINVGPQIDVGRAVEQLLASAKMPVAPGVGRVAISQRQQASALGGTITTTTDPTNISLAGRLLNAWITISPDWTGLTQARGVTYQLSATSSDGGGQTKTHTLATTAWARLQPSAIFAAAGMPVVSTSSRGVPLTYTASEHGKVVAKATFTLTFGPTDRTVTDVQAPIAPAVNTGKTIPVRYDISELANATNPTLIVSEPGRVDPSVIWLNVAYSVPLTKPTGTVNIPVSALPGGGIYGIGIQQSPGGPSTPIYSTFNYVRVSPTGTSAPPPPTLSNASTPAGHFLEPAYNTPFQVHYDVSDVPGADGAIVEISAPGPTVYGSDNAVDNPGGSQRDNDGIDTGSVAFVPEHGVRGTATFNGLQVGLVAAMDQEVRVFATNHGKIIGEASGVSTITMDGVRAADGGFAVLGFGVNSNGTDGFLTSNQTLADGSNLASIETFDQATAATHTVESTPDLLETINGGQFGVFGSDSGVVEDGNTGDLNLLNPVTGNAVTSTVTPPASLGILDIVAANQSTDQTAVLSFLNGHWLVTPADFATGTFGTPVDITAAIPSTIASPSPIGVAFNPTTDDAYVLVKDGFDGASVVLEVNLSSGQITSMPGPSGDSVGFALDPVTGKALIGNPNGYSIEDVNAQTNTSFTPGGAVYQFPVWIPGTKDFMIGEDAGPDENVRNAAGVITSSNDNEVSAVLVVDENGNIVHRYRDFNFFDFFLSTVGGLLQPGASSTAFGIGPLGQQVAPFQFQTQ